MPLPEIVIDPHYSPLQPLKGQDIFVTKPQFVMDTVWDGILYYLSK